MRLERRYVFLTWEISDLADFLFRINLGLVMANNVETSMKNTKCFLLLSFVILVFPFLRMAKANVTLYETPTNASVREKEQRNKHR